MFQVTLFALNSQSETKNRKEDDQTLWAGQMFPNPADELIYMFAALKSGLKGLAAYPARRLDQYRNANAPATAITNQQPLID